MRRLLPLLLVAMLTACSSDPPDAPSIQGLQTFDVEPKERHTTDRVTYDRTPPAGGPHWPAEAKAAKGITGWLRCGVYDAPVPNEFAVHSQEHGAVWLSYLPDAAPAGLIALAALAKDNGYVLVSPYPGQSGRVMASTWGAQLSVEKADDPRLKAFVKAYAGGGQGGEKGADCANGSLPGPAQEALDKANR